jgi:hypothetical protein
VYLHHHHRVFIRDLATTVLPGNDLHWKTECEDRIFFNQVTGQFRIIKEDVLHGLRPGSAAFEFSLSVDSGVDSHFETFQ